MDYINDLHEMCETISAEIGEANEKIRNAGGKLSAGDVDYIDKLTHALKSIKATIAMMENEDGYSSADGMPYSGNFYRMRNSYRGRSYARGRTNARRTADGRYSGYSRNGGLADELRALMEDAPEQMRSDLQRLADKADAM